MLVRPSVLFCLIAATALNGCALPADRAGQLGMSWARSDNAESARLVLGVPETDNVRVIAVCRPHSGEVDLTIIGRRGDGASVDLYSGKVWARYPGAGHPDEETYGAVDIDFKLSAEDPVLRQWTETGELKIVFPDRRILLPNAFGQAHDFVARCRTHV